MSTPLSFAVGNSLEVIEAIHVLEGKRCKLYNACVDIVATLLNMAKDIPLGEATEKAKEAIDSGEALRYFYKFIEYQGGNLRHINISDKVIKVRSKKSGEIKKIDALGAAKLAAKLGASKMTLDDTIDYSVGIMLNVSEGDIVNEGDLLMSLYVKDFKVKFNEEDFEFINIV